MTDSDCGFEAGSAECKLKWTQEMVIELIRLRGELSDDFTGKRGTGQQGWMKVAKKLGFPMEWKMIQKKWFNLVVKYKEIKTPRSGVSTEDGDIGPISWQYFDAMDGVLGDRHIINPPFLIDTSRSSMSSGPSPSPPALAFTSPSTSSSPIDFQNFIFLDSAQTSAAMPAISTHSTPKFSLYKSSYLGLGSKRSLPSGSGVTVKDREDAGPSEKKSKQDPYLQFLIDERAIAEAERKEEKERHQAEVASREKFQSSMLQMMKDMFDNKK